MNRKTLVVWSLIMILVFGLITIAYPLLFKPGPDKLAPPVEGGIEQPAAAL